MSDNESEGRLNNMVELGRPRPQPDHPQPAQAQERVAPAQRAAGATRSIMGMMPTTQNLNFIEEQRVLFLCGKTEVQDPGSESYLEMLRANYSPHLQCLSLTTLVVAICLTYYIVAVSIGFFNNTFLEVGNDTLVQLGANDSRSVSQGQVYRLLVSLFLHVNMIHLVANMIALVIIMSPLEYTFGWWTGLAYLAAPIVGNVFSNLISVDEDGAMIKSGATNAIFSLVGVSCGYLLVNWPSLAAIGPIFKFRMFAHIFFVVVFLLLFCDVASKPDFAGHLGGFVAGFLLTGLLPSMRLQKRELVVRVILGVLFLAMTLSCFLVFYLVPQEGYSR